MASIVYHLAWHPFRAYRRERLGLMSSEMTKNRPNGCAKVVSARSRGTLRTFVGFYPILRWINEYQGKTRDKND